MKDVNARPTRKIDIQTRLAQDRAALLKSPGLDRQQIEAVFAQARAGSAGLAARFASHAGQTGDGRDASSLSIGTVIEAIGQISHRIDGLLALDPGIAALTDAAGHDIADISSLARDCGSILARAQMLLAQESAANDAQATLSQAAQRIQQIVDESNRAAEDEPLASSHETGRRAARVVH